MSSRILRIARHTFAENIKHRNFIILFLFMIIVIGSGFLFSMLAPEQEIRVILDLGVAAIEIFAFLSAAFISSRLISKEVEQKTLYLVLTRPVTRTRYLAGRYTGILSVIGSYIILMTVFLTGILLLKGWSFDLFIAGIALSVFLKVLMVSALAILLSLATTSTASSFVAISFLWGLGHFSREVRFLILRMREAGSPAAFLLEAAYYAVPNFSRLNYKDFFHAEEVFSAGYFWNAGYALFYALAVFLLAAAVFERKEL